MKRTQRWMLRTIWPQPISPRCFENIPLQMRGTAGSIGVHITSTICACSFNPIMQPYRAALSLLLPVGRLALTHPPHSCRGAAVRLLSHRAREPMRSIPLPSGCPDRLLSICAHRLPAAGGRAVRRAAAAPDWAGRAIGSPHIRAGARDSLCGSSAAQFSCGACAQASAGDARPYVSPVTLCHLLAYPERGGVVASSGHLSSETPSLWRADDVLLVWRLERRDAQHPMAKDSQRPSNYRTQFFERVF